MKDESIDKLMNIMERKYLYAGLLAPLVGLSGVTLAVIIHSSWFSFQNNAISDLGRLGLEKNYILNMSLILAGILGVFFAYGLLKESESILKKLGACVFAAGLVSLILIGVFPEGTPPHNNVSLGFFLLTGFGILIIGIDALMKVETRKFGIFTVLDFLIVWILALWAIRVFKGVAIPELIGVLGIVFWTYALIFWRKFGIPSSSRIIL